MKRLKNTILSYFNDNSYTWFTNHPLVLHTSQQMNYTLKQLQQRVNALIEQQGEDAHCAAWIYTAEDCVIRDDDDNEEYVAVDNPELAERIFNDVGNIDYIYQVIQECVDESTEEVHINYQQELV